MSFPSESRKCAAKKKSAMSDWRSRLGDTVPLVDGCVAGGGGDDTEDCTEDVEARNRAKQTQF